MHRDFPMQVFAFSSGGGCRVSLYSGIWVSGLLGTASGDFAPAGECAHLHDSAGIRATEINSGGGMSKRGVRTILWNKKYPGTKCQWNLYKYVYARPQNPGPEPEVIHSADQLLSSGGWSCDHRRGTHRARDLDWSKTAWITLGQR